MKRWARARRWMGLAALTVSAALCVAVAMVWVRSYWTCDVMRWVTVSNGARSQTRLQMHSLGGVVSVVRVWREAQQSPPDVMGGGFQMYAFGSGPMPYSGFEDGERVLGFGAVRKVTVDTPTQQSWTRMGVCVPHWFLFMAFGLGPARWVVRRVLAKRRASGECPACGYDLRATPDRCPECGAVA